MWSAQKNNCSVFTKYFPRFAWQIGIFFVPLCAFPNGKRLWISVIYFASQT